MPSFTDRKGRIWELELDLLTCRRIDKSDFTEYYKPEFSILQMDSSVLQALFTRATLTFAVIWAIVRPQAVEKFIRLRNQSGQAEGETPPEIKDTFPINPDEDEELAQIEFTSGIGPQAKEDGKKAFFEALSDFFPELRTALSTADRSLRNLSKKVDDKVRETEPLLDEMLNGDMDAGIAEIKRRLSMTREQRLGEILSPSQQSPATPMQT